MAGARDVRYRLYHDLIGRLQYRGTHLSLVYLLEVVHVADLTRLGDTNARAETFPPVVFDGLCGVFGESAEDQITAD